MLALAFVTLSLIIIVFCLVFKSVKALLIVVIILIIIGIIANIIK